MEVLTLFFIHLCWQAYFVVKVKKCDIYYWFSCRKQFKSDSWSWNLSLFAFVSSPRHVPHRSLLMKKPVFSLYKWLRCSSCWPSGRQISTFVVRYLESILLCSIHIYLNFKPQAFLLWFFVKPVLKLRRRVFLWHGSWKLT